MPANHTDPFSKALAQIREEDELRRPVLSPGLLFTQALLSRLEKVPIPVPEGQTLHVDLGPSPGGMTCLCLRTQVKHKPIHLVQITLGPGGVSVVLDRVFPSHHTTPLEDPVLLEIIWEIAESHFNQ
jgi:hypothetical protein